MRNDVLLRDNARLSFRLFRDSTRAAINLQLTESDCAVSSRLDTHSSLQYHGVASFRIYTWVSH